MSTISIMLNKESGSRKNFIWIMNTCCRNMFYIERISELAMAMDLNCECIEAENNENIRCFLKYKSARAVYHCVLR